MKNLWQLPLLLILAGCGTPPSETVKYESKYQWPLNSPGGEFGAAPAAVQNTIRAETGSAGITHITTNYISGELAYEVHFVNPDIFPPLYIAPDGSVLNPDFSVAVPAPPVVATSSNQVALVDLPTPVLTALHDSAPGGTITSLEKEVWGNRVTYIIGFKDAVHYPKMYVSDDGTVLKEEHR